MSGVVASYLATLTLFLTLWSKFGNLYLKLIRFVQSGFTLLFVCFLSVVLFYSPEVVSEGGIV